MSTLSPANVTDVNLVLKERTHMHLCINMLIFTHNLGNWLIVTHPRALIISGTVQLHSSQTIAVSYPSSFETDYVEFMPC